METQLLALIDTEACLGNSTIYMKVESEISAQTSWHAYDFITPNYNC